MNFLKIKFLLLAIILTLVISCSKDKDGKPSEPAKLRIEFNLTSGGEPVSPYEIVSLPNSHDLMVKIFKVYFTDMKLVNNNGNELSIQNLALLNVGSEDDNYVEIEILKSTTYNSLAFGIGLTPEINNSDPGSFDQDHILHFYQNMHWGWLKYFFVKFEGIADTSGKLQSNVDFQLAYHTGTDSMYTEAAIPGNFSLSTGKNTTIQVNVNLDKLFASPDNPIDFITENQTHSDSSDIHIAYKFTNNMIGALSAQQN